MEECVKNLLTSSLSYKIVCYPKHQWLFRSSVNLSHISRLTTVPAFYELTLYNKHVLLSFLESCVSQAIKLN